MINVTFPRKGMTISQPQLAGGLEGRHPCPGGGIYSASAAPPNALMRSGWRPAGPS